MTKIVINSCYGGFGISNEAVLRAREISGEPRWAGSTMMGETYPNSTEVCNRDWGSCFISNLPRTDLVLVQVIEELGNKANAPHAKLEIVDIPAGSAYRIAEYDGMEWIELRDEIEWLIA